MDCLLHLVALQDSSQLKQFLDQVKAESKQRQPWLIKGRPHGWVRKVHDLNAKELLAHDWHLCLLTDQGSLPHTDLVKAHISVKVSVPQEQYDKLQAQVHLIPEPMKETPALPSQWPREGGIPSTNTVPDHGRPLKPGELNLDPAMVDFLSSALPPTVANAPVAFMNLFAYPNGDSSTHDSYMQGFKDNFGNAAGASVKFMGPVKGDLKYNGQSTSPADGCRWQDANLVQYDSIWHYAYMLSTDVYKKLNKEKVAGLDDTCILVVSEYELAQL